MDLTKVAEKLIKLSGGLENITSITHCATRLRFFIADKSKVKQEQIKKTKPVLGVVFSGDELQIVLGQNLMPVFNAAMAIYDDTDTKKRVANDEPKTLKDKLKSSFMNVIGFVSASVTPMIPGLVAGGMLKVFLVLMVLAVPEFKEGDTYKLLGMVANVPFYFMAIFVAYGAAKKLGSTPVYPMIVSAALVYPQFIDLLKNYSHIDMLGIPVTNVNYATTLLPALLISLCAYYVENFLAKVVPGLIRPILIGVGTITITFIIGITVLGPLGDVIGSYIVHIFLWADTNMGPLAVGILSGCMPFLVMTGMHHAVTPFMVQAIVNPGYDTMFRPAYILHNMAEGGAVLGVGLRAKNKAFKAECFSLAFACIVAGVTEPTIYGVNLRLKKPLIGVVCGAVAGGIVARMLGATAFVYGYSTILAVPIFQDTVLAILAAIAVAIAVAATVTFVLGFEESEIVSDDDNEEEKTEADAIVPMERDKLAIKAVADGHVIALENVDDEIFSQKALGDGVAIEPAGNLVVAPCAAKITMVAADSGHAVGMKLANGAELLIHVGIDTVKMGGKGFKLLVSEGDDVKAGMPLMKFDPEAIEKAGYKKTIMLIMTNSFDYEDMELAADVEAKAGETVVIKC